MSLDMSIVFKLNSLEDLDNLTQALKQTATLQAKIKLEQQIKRLAKEKAALRIEVEALKMEKHGLQPPSDEKKAIAEKEEEEDEERPSSLRRDGERLIDLITEEPVEETAENVEADPEAPE